MNYRPHLPRASRRPRSNEVYPFSFTSLTTCNPFTLNSFADPHTLNPVLSILYKKRWGEGVIPGRTSAIFCFPYTLPSSVSRNSFVCHSYENCRGVYQQFPFWFTQSAVEGFTQSGLREGSIPPARTPFCSSSFNIPIGGPKILWAGDPDRVGTFQPSNVSQPIGTLLF